LLHVLREITLRFRFRLKRVIILWYLMNPLSVIKQIPRILYQIGSFQCFYISTLPTIHHVVVIRWQTSFPGCHADEEDTIIAEKKHARSRAARRWRATAGVAYFLAIRRHKVVSGKHREILWRASKRRKKIETLWNATTLRSPPLLFSIPVRHAVRGIQSRPAKLPEFIFDKRKQRETEGREREREREKGWEGGREQKRESGPRL